jgi:hypothetical protein
MSPNQSTLFDLPSLAQVRKHDPLSARIAAAGNRSAKATQIKALLRRMLDGPITADEGGLLIGTHRSIASARLGVMVKRGLAEHAGEKDERSADGGPKRRVLLYRVTPAGRAEWQAMFGGTS